MAKMNQKKELGKGIRALLGDIHKEIEENNNSHQVVVKEVIKEVEVIKVTSSVNLIPISSIEVNPFQPRVHFDEEALNELASSIKIHGIIQPMTLREIGSDKYQLISGERRWRASQMAGLTEVPAYVRKANDQEALEMALIENIQREELNAIEIGVNYQRLMDECQLNQEELAVRVGKKRATVSNYIRLLKLPPDIQVAVREDKLSMGHARAMAGVEQIDVLLSIYNEVMSKNLSVRQTEALVAQSNLTNHTPRSPKGKVSPPPFVKKWQDNLASKFSTKVNINHQSNGSGVITFNYADETDLSRIIDLISK